MARAVSVEFNMYFKVDFETVIRGHHVYKSTWTPMMDQELELGVYFVKKHSEEKKLVGHVPKELSRLMKHYLNANSANKLFAYVTGKRKREVGLVVPARFTAMTTDLQTARILNKELNGKVIKYTHFELKNIVINESKTPKLF
ncbi:unnamed protein product [Porites lobata]|uniref:Uncharacterized protein n=1 Tax=Porites lobata TaxID=104759 RepID=A0ABN8QDZ1_9CNID|nr:unnamed protein product [Porites lobata]